MAERTVEPARPGAITGERRHERADHHAALLEEQPSDLSDSPDVLPPFDLGESQITAQAMAHLVPIQQHRLHACLEERALEQRSDRRLPRAG